MLKVSKARVYLRKLASAAKVVRLSRMMEKMAADPPKPKGINSGVDVSKGLNTASNSANGQNVNAAPGAGGSLQNVTSAGNSNSAITGVGGGSKYNVAKPLPTSATGLYKNKGSNEVRTAALPAPGAKPSRGFSGGVDTYLK